MKLSYDRRYNLLLQKFSALRLYRIVLRFAEKAGNPYPLYSRGRKPKLLPYEYAGYLSYMVLIHGATFRDMEFECELYTGKHIDHSTFVVNFEKMPVEYFLSVLEETGTFLDRLLTSSTHYVIDSTAVTTPLCFVTIIKGKEVKERIEYKSHAIVSLHPEEHALCVRLAMPSDKHLADCEAAKRMLEQGKIKEVMLHGDRGYDYERTYKACFEHDVHPNVRPQGYTSQQDEHRIRGIAEYDDGARKKHRGLIEAVFGGITNAGLMTTRLRKHTKTLCYAILILLRQNIKTIARQLAC
jgi:hypothetical protein